ncbi:MAG: symmetrical bis(5'-nucleosyl)-tetraphosphatase [Gammaproteobacteria bacterium]|uniref:bis(5'-nucleosyl)-tetraphosphatase (symmetrical) n=1 Tax=endosymbiont of Bathymodiolus septemdierum str. Myojin knoll TaxID=1303921 RepID=A0A0P0US41_9GAMM|nr:symmetrical bis(5'-nucleosyl)-tetraphosphatase [Bathymodiolus septemdierum thioautotrophic gill symbiont]RUA05188.1 MAG: symmetrical bis(5'-nucleosyl)-tetraphosphatase [Gammaproteobacteria bacterium]BAS67888.1 bis(5'-nucleosyl)-tetraphosphatase (symmetrical) [endosymbiont of Bathymodiolus septemdierum str. Myojin knoll]
MSSYLIGDIQGCFDDLQALLKKANFSTDKDQLFFLGDVVNRGTKSLETLRFIKDLSDNAKMLLGNHDFHLLACTLGGKTPSNKDTFSDILEAKDSLELIDFLRQQPLVIEHQDALLVHAGVPPIWDKPTLLTHTTKVEAHLQGNQAGAFIDDMYGNKPSIWTADLNTMDNCRYTINACMRMRFCTADGELEFKGKMGSETAPKGFKAWFLHENRVLKNTDIFFGHWSTLTGVTQPHIYPMDKGCAWGGRLNMIRFEDRKIFSVTC